MKIFLVQLWTNISYWRLPQFSVLIRKIRQRLFLMKLRVIAIDGLLTVEANFAEINMVFAARPHDCNLRPTWKIVLYSLQIRHTRWMFTKTALTLKLWTESSVKMLEKWSRTSFSSLLRTRLAAVDFSNWPFVELVTMYTSRAEGKSCLPAGWNSVISSLPLAILLPGHFKTSQVAMGHNTRVARCPCEGYSRPRGASIGKKVNAKD